MFSTSIHTFWTSRFICFGVRFLYIRLRIRNIRLRIRIIRLRLQKQSTSIEILLFVFLSATERHTPLKQHIVTLGKAQCGSVTEFSLGQRFLGGFASNNVNNFK